MGWDAIAVTDHCQNLDAAFKVIDFLASEEGQYLMLWGIEGEDWEYVDGRHTPTAKGIALLDEDISEVMEETGIRKWLWFIKNGNGSDGTPYDFLTKYQLSRETVIANKRMPNDYWDTSEYFGLNPETGTDESLMWINIENIYEKAFPKMVNADSQEEMQETYSILLRDMEEAGLSKVEEIWTQKYKKRGER